MAKVMSVNCGSSSFKFKLYEMPEEKVICNGIVERIGHDDAIFTIKYNGEKITSIVPVKDHGVAVQIVIDKMLEMKIIKSIDEIKATGHRIVQGGAYFDRSVPFDEDAYKKIESLIPLAPLHNKAHLTGFDAFKKVLPNTPAVAVFDTAFHQTMAPEDYIFPIPYEYTEKYMIRRYGAHGTSHKYLSEVGAKYIDSKDKKMIICHLGSGASITAVRNGKCVATSMGLTPLGGIEMNSRTGDMDPSVFYQVASCTGKDVETVFQEFNKKSGLYGVSGVSNDSRDVSAKAAEGDYRSQLALDLWGRRVADFIGQYYVRLGGCDLIIFSAGIGENDAGSRKLALTRIQEALGIDIDWKVNEETFGGKEAVLSTPKSKIKVVVIPTDEEVMIARDAYNICLKK
ncbi:MAG: acetate kinase [Bacilli bacterium]|nr:acetate kinase [Bacilli bacterium]